MEHKLENGTLTLYFEGELNSYSADDVEKEIEEIVNKNEFRKLILDFSKLKYISSAGLRIVLKLKQKYDDTKVVKVNKDVYDIFEMVGFSNLITVERA